MVSHRKIYDVDFFDSEKTIILLDVIQPVGTYSSVYLLLLLQKLPQNIEK